MSFSFNLVFNNLILVNCQQLDIIVYVCYFTPWVGKPKQFNIVVNYGQTYL